MSKRRSKPTKWIKDNPAEEAERVKVATEHEEDMDVTPDKVYSRGEIRKLIDATEPESRERLMLMVPELTGLRIGEVLGLTWSAVDLKSGKLRVISNLADTDRGQPLRIQRNPIYGNHFHNSASHPDRLISST